MKMILHFIIFFVLAISFSGCWLCPEPPEPEVITKIVYVKRPMPELIQRPVPDEYNVLGIEFNGDDYYALPKIDAAIMSSNWIVYRDWCETNYLVLKNMKND